MTDSKQKRYSLSSEEKQEMTDLKRVFDDLYLQQQGIRRLMDVVMAKVQVRLGIADTKAPDGFNRRMSLDDTKYELVVEDVPEIPSK